MAVDPDPVIAAREGAVLQLTLARPEKLNALNGAMLSRLRAGIAQAESDPEIRVVVLAGQGRAFSAGADLADATGPGREAFLDELRTTFDALDGVRKPVLGVLNGLTLAGGLELALRCDLLVAAESARIGDGHVRHGLVPGGGSATLLPGRIGRARANQLLLTGELLPARTLLDWGLLNWVVPEDELAAFATELAGRIAALDPEALAAMKRLARPDLAEALAREHQEMRAHLGRRSGDPALARFADPGAPP